VNRACDFARQRVARTMLDESPHDLGWLDAEPACQPVHSLVRFERELLGDLVLGGVV
jgi:hypothetical protein